MNLAAYSLQSPFVPLRAHLFSVFEFFHMFLKNSLKSVIFIAVSCSIRSNAVFFLAFPMGTCLLFGCDTCHDSGAAVLAVQKVIDLLGQVLAGQLAVLGAGARVLAFDDDAGGDVLELDGGVGFVLDNGFLCII